MHIFEKSVHLLFLGDFAVFVQCENRHIYKAKHLKRVGCFGLFVPFSLSSARAGVTTTTMTAAKSRPNSSNQQQKAATQSQKQAVSSLM